MVTTILLWTIGILVIAVLIRHLAQSKTKYGWSFGPVEPGVSKKNPHGAD
jgi:hypothetical protein